MKNQALKSGFARTAELSRRSHGMSHHARRGFALVVTVSLLVLLSVIALGFLSLSAVSLRSGTQEQAQMEAKANARLALQIAIGELQDLAGQDTRVTASSGVIDESNVPATGVWRSWEGSDRDATGKPTIPVYTLKNQAGDPTKPLGASTDGRFLGWLASPMANATPNVASLAGLSATETSGSVKLVGYGSVIEPASPDDPPVAVYAIPTMTDNGDRKGAYAWWISGDNAKAMLNVDRTPTPTSTVAWHTRMKSNGKADAKTFGIGELDTLPITTSIPSTSSLELLGTTTDIRRLHDMTAFSRGLLTNTATGGWRRDLSLLSETTPPCQRPACPH